MPQGNVSAFLLLTHFLPGHCSPLSVTKSAALSPELTSPLRSGDCAVSLLLHGLQLQGAGGYSPVVMSRLLTAVVSLVAEDVS